MKWSEDLRNMVSTFIRRYINNMKFAAYMAVSFIKFFLLILFYFLSLYMWLFVLYACL